MKIARRFAIDTLESRRLLATVSWDNGGDGTTWDDPRNWSGNVVPAAADDVTISNIPAVVTSGSAKRVASLSLINSTLTLGSDLTGLSNLSLTDSTLRVGTSASGAADVQAYFLAMSNVSRIEGQTGSTLWTSLISAFGSGGSVIDLPMSVIEIEVSGGDLRLNQCANLVDGVLTTSREWYVSGRLEMNGGAPILINRGSLSLSGAMAHVAGLENLTRNEGGLSFTNHTAHFTGSLTNAGTLAFGGRTTADPLFMQVDGTFTASERLSLNFIQDGSSASDEPAVIQAGSVAGQFHEVLLSGSNVIASVTPSYDPQAIRLHLAPKAPPTPALFIGDSSGVYPSQGISINQTTPRARIETRDAGTVQVLIDGDVVSTFTSTARQSAYQSVTLPALTPGLHRLTAQLIDAQGVTSTASASYQFTVDLTPPVFVSSVFQYQSQQQVSFTFNERIDYLPGQRFVVRNEAGEPVEIPGATTSLSGNNVNVQFSRTTPLPDGNWTVQLLATGFADAAGNPLTDDPSQAFYVLAGDANRDRIVDFSDLLIAAQNYGRTGRTFSQGNFNYDSSGRVNFDDLLLLAQRYGRYLAPAASPMTALSQRGRRADGAAGLVDSI